MSSSDEKDISALTNASKVAREADEASSADSSTLTAASKIARERMNVALGLDTNVLTAASRITREQMDPISGIDASSLTVASRVARERLDMVSRDYISLTATSKTAGELLGSSTYRSATALDQLSEFRKQLDTAIGIGSRDPLTSLSTVVDAGLSITSLLDSKRHAVDERLASVKETISVLGEMHRPYDQFATASSFAPYAGSIASLASVSGIAASIEHLSMGVSPNTIEQISSVLTPESVRPITRDLLASVSGVQLLSTPLSSLSLASLTSEIAGVTLASTRTLLGLESAYNQFVDVGSPRAGSAGIPSYLKTLHEGVGSLASAAKLSWDVIALTPNVLDSTSLFSALAPSIEIYSASHAAAVISLLVENFPPIYGQIEDIIDETVDEFEDRLSLLEPAFVEMYRGGIAAMEAGGPDWRRQSMASFRELMTHLLHTLAPNVEVEPWAKPHHFDKGKLTRKARLEYVFESVAGGEFTGFFKADVKASIELFDLLNNGTHRLTSKATPKQLRYLRGRIVNLITCMLEAKGH